MKRKWTEEQLVDSVKNSISFRQMLGLLGLKEAGGNYKSMHRAMHRAIAERKLDTSHWLGQAHLRGKKRNWMPPAPLDRILVANNPTQSYKLKKRLISAGLLEDICSEPKCKTSMWLGVKLELHLDHINGINNDNRIENLRLLCPNCHSQTATYCGKNKGKN